MGAANDVESNDDVEPNEVEKLPGIDATKSGAAEFSDAVAGWLEADVCENSIAALVLALGAGISFCAHSTLDAPRNSTAEAANLFMISL
jgi:hypothetical protein